MELPASEGLIPMMNDYVAAALARDRSRELIAEAEAYRRAKLARRPEPYTRHAPRQPARWLRAFVTRIRSGRSPALGSTPD
jgi:hypothetical protein